MRIVRNKYIPVSGFRAMNFLGLILFVRGNAKISERTMNHEAIHSAQMREMLYVLFYLWYIVEWLIRLPKGNAYRNISFEREAYANQNDPKYLENRGKFSFFKYLRWKV